MQPTTGLLSCFCLLFCTSKVSKHYWDRVCFILMHVELSHNNSAENFEYLETQVTLFNSFLLVLLVASKSFAACSQKIVVSLAAIASIVCLNFIIIGIY